MSTPHIDLSKVDYTSLANSFKNDNQIYTGSIIIQPLSVPAGAAVSASKTITLTATPEFSTLYGYFEELQDALQRTSVGSGYNPPAWYETSFAQPAFQVTTAPFTSIIGGHMYVILNGNQLTIRVDFNNPYPGTVTYNAVTIPYAFVIFTLTN